MMQQNGRADSFGRSSKGGRRGCKIRGNVLLVVVGSLILMSVCLSWGLAHHGSAEIVSVDENASKLRGDFVRATQDGEDGDDFVGHKAPRMKGRARRDKKLSGKSNGKIVNVPEKLKKQARDLSSLRIKYYIYGDDRISQPNIIKQLKQTPKWEDCDSDYFVNVRRDADAEILVLDALRNHEFRVQRPEMGEVMIIPLSAAAIITWFGRDRNTTRETFDTVFKTLLGSAWFQSFRGEDHILLSLETQMFSQVRRPKLETHGLAQYYGALENVTIANDMDWAGCRKLTETKKKRKVYSDFAEYFQKVQPPENKYGFSVGLLPAEDIPYIEATYEKFQNASNFLFFWTKTHFKRNSDDFRLAIFDEGVVEKLPPSSIGIESNRTDWLQDFQDSKFCLVVRGDTPHSHALMRSVKVGCIPVVVSDTYATYAPTLKSTLDMEDYVIFIKEKEFLRDPLGELSKLKEISEEDIRIKLQAVAFAQRVSVPDHPSSLFVPAFLKEARKAMKNPIVSPSAITRWR